MRNTNKSIDGLRRRSTDVSAPLGAATRKAKKIEVTTKVQRSTPQRRTIATSPEKAASNQQDRAIQDFLKSVRDDDPTNLVGELPEKKRGKRSKKDKKPKKKKRTRRIVLSIVGFLLLVIVAGVVWLYIQGNDLISKVTGGNLIDAIFADPDTPLATDPKTGRTNILIFGTEGYNMDDPNYDGGWLTDSMMVASLDQDSGDIRTISLPRDLKAKTCYASSKLNEVYSCTYSKNDGSAESRNEHEKQAARDLADQIEEVLGVEIQYFAHANWQALTQIVDAIGGVDVAFVYKGETWSGDEIAIETTDKRGLADQYDNSCGCYKVNYKNGEVAHLNGTQALAVARARNAYGGYGASGGNFSREQFQQKILQAAIMKAKQTNFVADFMAALKIKDAVGDNLRMDFQDTELKTLFRLAGEVDLGAMKSISLHDTGDGSSLFTTGMLPVPGVNNLNCGGSRPGCLSYVFPKAGVGNYSEIHKYIAQKLSSDPAIAEGARIEVMNATDTAGLAASESGKLEDKGYNVVKTTNAPSGLSSVSGVKVYQLNKAMGGTAAALKEIYGDVVTTEIPSALKNEAADFVVVLGAGFGEEASE